MAWDWAHVWLYLVGAFGVWGWFPYVQKMPARAQFIVVALWPVLLPTTIILGIMGVLDEKPKP